MKQVLAQIWDCIRLVGAGCFFFFVIIVAFAFFPSVKWNIPSFLVGLGVIVGFCLLLWVVFRLFGDKKEPSVQRRAVELLDKQGLLITTNYKAVRAFQVEGLEDEGLHFYIELVGGSVLFLSGQYLYDYDPKTEPELNKPRRFPCTEFTIKRLKTEGWAGKIECRSTALKPEIVAPPFDEADCDKKRVPEDGEIITDVSYDELKNSAAGLGSECKNG